MKNEGNEFLDLLCKLYMAALLAALPLYTGKGYWNLGDTKYMLFRNLSLLCLCGWLVVWLPGRILSAGKRLRAFLAGRTVIGQGGQFFGPMDRAVGFYGITVVISALLSEYQELAWNGYAGWYMGAVSQLLFVGIYFFVSRQYDGGQLPLYLGEIALFLVTVLGLLQRLGVDPLGLLAYWTIQNWEYGHMLSTLGNINWLCGYYSVALALLAVHFLWEERVWLRAILYVSMVSAYVLLGVQGSQGGFLILLVCTAVCLLLGQGKPMIQGRVFMLLAGFFLCMPLMGFGMELRGEKAAMAADGNVFDYVGWYIWAAACAVSLAAYRRIVRTGRLLEGRAGHCVRKAALGTVAAVLVFGAAFLAVRGIDDSFGSGRGFLWRIALESFRQADIKDKLLGAGPDCYGEAVFNRLGAGSEVWEGEHWENAAFTNAHNEILSQLCNVGLLGTGCYLAIFVTGLRRYFRACRGQASRDLQVGLLALAMYGAHAMISFQQVLNAPLLFLVLGICERRIRIQNTGEKNGTGE